MTANEELNKFYQNYDWYIPNPNYVPDEKILNDIEKKWIEKWK